MTLASQLGGNQYTIQMLLQQTYTYLAAVERETKELMKEEKLKPITDAKNAVREMINQEGELNRKIIENFEDKLAEAEKEAEKINWSELPHPN